MVAGRPEGPGKKSASAKRDETWTLAREQRAFLCVHIDIPAWFLISRPQD